MKLEQVIENIGNKAIITSVGDLVFDYEMSKIIGIELTIIKLTKTGKVLMSDGKKGYAVPIKNVSIK